MKLICQWCNQEFEGNRKDTKYCSRSCQAKASRNRLKNGINALEHICPKCNSKFIVKENAFNRRYCYNCISETPKSGAAMRQIIKQWALDYKGHKCCRCGYNKCDAALEFHHINPSQKKFIISDRNLNQDWNIIKQELDKCELVCSNCHREIHEEKNNNET